MTSKCLTVCNLSLLLLIIFIFISYRSFCEDNTLIIDIKNPPKHIVEKYFLSVALDSSVVANKFWNFNMSDPKLLNLVSHFSPAYLRIGGNMADRLIFSRDKSTAQIFKTKLDGGECAYDPDENICDTDHNNFTMTGTEWIKINEFAKKVGLIILFDVNCLIRNENGSWNFENANDLISFTNEHEFNINWQLGNEPDAFNHQFNIIINASQLAKDFLILRNILNRYPRYKNAKLVGPDTTRPRNNHQNSMKYMKTFLQNSEHILDAVTWHQYYLNGRTAELKDFFDPKIFDLLEEQIKLAIKILNETGFTNTPLWLSETGSAYGGGAPNLSDRFAASFLWLDKLGLCAKYGLQIVIRQSLFSGHYALISDNYEPTPDWWISMAYKKFVGPEVIGYNLRAPNTVRLYCHCVDSTVLTSGLPAITVFGVNIESVDAYVEIVDSRIPNREDKIGHAYVFTAGNMSLDSKIVLLNGKVLSLLSNGSLPIFKPVEIDLTKPLKMPPFSLVFWIIPSADIEACSYI